MASPPTLSLLSNVTDNCVWSFDYDELEQAVQLKWIVGKTLYCSKGRIKFLGINRTDQVYMFVDEALNEVAMPHKTFRMNVYK